jgi:hypothetical protein
MLYLKFERNIHSIPKVRDWMDQLTAFDHFSAKNIPFENGKIPFHSISFQKSWARNGQILTFDHFSAKNIPFENRKYPDDIS